MQQVCWPSDRKAKTYVNVTKNETDCTRKKQYMLKIEMQRMNLTEEDATGRADESTNSVDDDVRVGWSKSSFVTRVTGSLWLTLTSSTWTLITITFNICQNWCQCPTQWKCDIYTVSGKKKRPRYFQLQLSHFLVDFYNSRTIGKRNEYFTTMWNSFTWMLDVVITLRHRMSWKFSWW